MTDAWRGTAIRVQGRAVCTGVGFIVVLLAAGCTSPRADPLSSLEIAPASLDVVDAGTSAQLSAIGTYRDGTTHDLTSSVAWSTSDTAIARVNASGVLLAGIPGAVTITATSDSTRATSTMRVRGIEPLGARTLMDAPAGYLDNPVSVLDGAGRVLVAYGINDGTVWPPVRSLIAQRSSVSWPPSWTAVDTGVPDASQTSGPDLELAANAAGAAGVVYLRTPDGTNGSFDSFGVAYFDGATWPWGATVQGSAPFWYLLDKDAANTTPVVAVDADGGLFVAYRPPVSSGLTQFSVAQFAPDGSSTVTTFPESAGSLYAASNASGQVMVLNSSTGSRLHDAAGWGTLEPFQPTVGAHTQLTLHDDGTATLFGAGYQEVQLYRRDGAGWSAGPQVPTVANPDGWAVASTAAGRAVIAVASFDQITARVVDGDSVGPEVVLDVADSGASVRNPSVLVDGVGHFVVVWERGGSTGAMRAAWFDGGWHAAVDIAPTGVFVPAVVMRPDGFFVVVDDFGVYDSLYSATFALRP